jgi:dipicolinate synthase subunit B
MLLKDIKIGFAITGSFCTFGKIMPEIQRIVDEGSEVFPIMSEASYNTDTRFGSAAGFIDQIEAMTGKKIIATIKDAEPIGPKSLLDVIVIAPCTGNTIAKLANAITDTPVTMSVKAHLRNSKPVVIAISTNDGLGTNAKNIGALLNLKNIFFVPLRQDNPKDKPNSLVADMDLIIPTIIEALNNKQIQPIMLGSGT